MKVLDKLIVWYLKKYNKCFIQNTMHGDKIILTLGGSSTRIESFTVGAYEKYGTLREADRESYAQ